MYFFMDLGQLAQHHRWPVAEDLHELAQRSLQALRGFENDERDPGGRGTGN